MTDETCVTSARAEVIAQLPKQKNCDDDCAWKVT